MNIKWQSSTTRNWKLSPKIQSIEKEINDKDKEIRDRLDQDSQSGLSDEDMQKKVQSAQQERMIFIQSKQKQIQSMVESQAAQIAKEKASASSCIREPYPAVPSTSPMK